MSGNYRDDDEAITDINITPFVDVVLVVLIVFMVSMKFVVARGVDIEKPKAETGAPVQSLLTLKVLVDDKGKLFVNGYPFDDDALAIGTIKVIAADIEAGSRKKTPDADPSFHKAKAIIANDRRGAYAGVMRAIDLVQQAGITAIALENERP